MKSTKLAWAVLAAASISSSQADTIAGCVQQGGGARSCWNGGESPQWWCADTNDTVIVMNGASTPSPDELVDWPSVPMSLCMQFSG